jgi:hypothetical protein
MAIKVFHAHGPTAWRIYCTRITDKSGWLPCTMVLDALAKHIQPGVHHTIRLWMDTGTHYRCRQALTMMAHTVLTRFKGIRVTMCDYFCEQHGKGDCDRMFSVLSLARKLGAQRTAMFDIADVIAMYEVDFRRRCSEIESDVMEHYCEWWPDAKAKSKFQLMTLKSIPCPVRQCLAWSFTRSDVRRAQLRGRAPLQFQHLTGVIARAHLLSDNGCTAEMTFVPILSVDSDSDPECDEIHISDVTHQTKNFMGWKCSYRADEPEKASHLGVLPSLRRRAAMMSEILQATPEPKRHKPLEEVYSSAKDSQAKKAKTDKARRELFAYVRGAGPDRPVAPAAIEL